MPVVSNEEIRHPVWIRSTVYVLVLIGFCALGGVILYAVATKILDAKEWVSITREHFAATVGLPVAVLAAMFVVLSLEAKSGRIEFEAWGLKFKGASGEVVLFVLVFMAFVVGIKLLW